MRIKALQAALALGIAAFQSQALSAEPSTKIVPGLALGRTLNGPDATVALGEHLPDVATIHRMTPDELRRVLNEDRAVRVDPDGRLFYADATPEDLSQAGAVATDTGFSTSGSIPPADAFLLHSRPGAKKLIYLDFDGHTLSGTVWNARYAGGATITAPAWDTDGNRSSFSVAERTVIVNVWKRVAEDYAPFDVDVTTQYPGETALTRSSSSDTAYGMRILISPISSYVGNYGGIAYVGTFDDTSDYYKTALVFPENLAHNEKYIAEACAHECGHTLGLSHDGTTTGTEYYAGQGSGETGWAPIMGSSYSKNLTQWSKGEYLNANNKQDDLATIAGFLGYIGDDYGNDNATAAVFPSGTQLTAVGTLEQSTDRDVFKFTTGAGLVSINVTPADLGPDVDIAASIYSSSGQLVCTTNPGPSLAARLSIVLSAGTYYLHVIGTGLGDPLSTGYSDYASVGQYDISGTIVSTANLPPNAVATATPTSGAAPLTVQFSSALSSDPDGTIVARSWTFGNGASSSVANPSYTYSTAGTFTATLTVTDNSGQISSATVQIVVAAPNQSPIARASATPSSGIAPVTVTLTGSNSYDPDGSIVSYAWNFGDGTTGSGPQIQHTYASGGTYSATLTVTDNLGAKNSASVIIQVAPGSSADEEWVTGQNLGLLRNDYTGVIGVQILVGTQPITVTALGRMVGPGNSRSHTLKLIRASDGADIPGASVVVNASSGTPGQFQYGLLPSAVTLSANTAYYLVTDEIAGGDTWYNWDTTVTTTDVGIINAVVWGQTKLYTNPVSNQSFGPVSFKYSSPSSADKEWVTGQNLGLLRNDYTGVIGVQIRVGAQPITVTALGRMAGPGNSRSHTLKLIRASDGADIQGASVVINAASGTAGQFQYGLLPSAVTLSADTAYYLVTDEVAGGDTWYNWDTTVTTTGVGLINAVVWGQTSLYTSPVSNQSFGPVSFKYSSSSTAKADKEWVTGQNLGLLRNNYSGVIGVQIRVGSQPVTVTALGRMVGPGNSHSHTLKLIRASDGADIPGASVVVNAASGTPGQFQYGLLSSAVTLSAGTAYYLVTDEVAGGDTWYHWDTTVTTTGVGLLNAIVWGQVSLYTYSVNNQSFGPVSFKYSSP